MVKYLGKMSDQEAKDKGLFNEYLLPFYPKSEELMYVFFDDVYNILCLESCDFCTFLFAKSNMYSAEGTVVRDITDRLVIKKGDKKFSVSVKSELVFTEID